MSVLLEFTSIILCVSTRSTQLSLADAFCEHEWRAPMHSLRQSFHTTRPSAAEKKCGWQRIQQKVGGYV
jgi:hypothetical protein